MATKVTKKSSKHRWSMFFIILLILVIIGLIAYTIGYQIGNKMVQETAVINSVQTWIYL